MGSEDSGDGGFLSRWSRRKAQVRQGHEPDARGRSDLAPPAAAPGAASAVSSVDSAATVAAALGTTAAATASPPTTAPATVAHASAAGSGSAHAFSRSAAGAAGVPAAAVEADPGPASDAVQPGVAVPTPPTLNDVEQLGADSDYRSFVARDVDPQVRNAAFKKLFHSDPHFNVMDGLDVYIDDYNTPRPLSLAIMKTLVQARTLGLIDDELKDQDLPPPDGPAASAESADGMGDPAPSTEAGTTQAGDAEVDQALGVDGRPSGDMDTGDVSDMGSDTGSAGAPPANSGVLAQALEQTGHDAAGSEPAGAEIVHVVHAVPLVAVSAPLQASMATAAPGTVIPFPRRPGSADPA